MILNFANKYGYYGTTLLKCVNFIYLLKTPKFLLVFVLFAFFVNPLVNLALKNIIREPRPHRPIISLSSGEQTKIEQHSYGMPSSSSHTASFIAVFSWLITQNTYLLFFNLFTTAIIVFRKYKTNNHTVKQLFVGLLIGACMAFSAVFITKEKFSK